MKNNTLPPGEDKRNGKQLVFGLTLREKELYSLERFCEGRFNSVALAAVIDFGIKKGPGSIVITGPGKCGKTHLLRGLVLKKGQYADSREIVKLGKKGMGAAFKKLGKKRLVSLDDIDRVGGAEDFYERLFNLFNELIDKNGRLAVSMRLSPARARFMPGYLSTRLLSGMIATIKKPGETDLKEILLKLAHDRQISLTVSAVKYVMERSARSVAELSALVERLEKKTAGPGKRIGLQHLRRVIQSKTE